MPAWNIILILMEQPYYAAAPWLVLSRLAGSCLFPGWFVPCNEAIWCFLAMWAAYFLRLWENVSELIAPGSSSLDQERFVWVSMFFIRILQRFTELLILTIVVPKPFLCNPDDTFVRYLKSLYSYQYFCLQPILGTFLVIFLRKPDFHSTTKVVLF